MGTEKTTTRRCRVAVLTGAMALVLGGSVHGQDEADRPSGRGFVWGAGISAGRLGLPGGEDVALVPGEVTGRVVIAGETMDLREGELVDASRPAGAGAADRVSLPSNEVSAGFSFDAGYAFSPRVALLLQAELVAGVESGFSSAQGGLVLRFWPTSRLWLEAGPASGDLSYGYEGGVVEEFTGTGYGVRAGAGFTVLQRTKWALDLEARFGTLSFDGFRATSVSVGVSATSRPR